MSDLPENLYPVPPELREEPYPAQAHIGFELTGWAEDFARFEMDLADHHRNRHGNLHGAIYAALLDSAMGFAGAYTGDPDNKRHTMTLSMTTNFMAPAQGLRLVAEGRRIGGGRKTFFTEGRMWDGTGVLVATATGTFKVRSGGGS